MQEPGFLVAAKRARLCSPRKCNDVEWIYGPRDCQNRKKLNVQTSLECFWLWQTIL